MEVCSVVSGETLAFCNAEEVEGKSVKEVKRGLAVRLGVPRFRQRLFLENGSVEISDDEILGAGTVKVWLVLLAFERTVGSPDGEMMEACQENNTELLEKRLQCPCDPNLKCEGEISALVEAVARGHVEAIELLLEAGADKHERIPPTGLSLLELAVHRNDFDTVHLLIEAGADVNRGGNSPLCTAAILGHVDIARLLLDSGADPNFTNQSNGWSPLWAAASEGRLTIVRLLLEAGADKTLTAHNGLSPLRVAAQNGHLAVASILRLSRKRTKAMVEE